MLPALGLAGVPWLVWEERPARTSSTPVPLSFPSGAIPAPQPKTADVAPVSAVSVAKSGPVEAPVRKKAHTATKSVPAPPKVASTTPPAVDAPTGVAAVATTTTTAENAAAAVPAVADQPPSTPASANGSGNANSNGERGGGFGGGGGRGNAKGGGGGEP